VRRYPDEASGVSDFGSCHHWMTPSTLGFPEREGRHEPSLRRIGLTQYAKRWNAVFLAAIPGSALILLGLGV
jgi:hypothetical protein